MKNLFFLVFFILLLGSVAGAQPHKKGFHFGVGGRIGTAVADLRDLTTFGLGGEGLVEYVFHKNFSAIASGGYTYFFGEEIIPGFTLDGVGITNLLAGMRVYPADRVFLGLRAGFAALTSGGTTAGTFNIEPHVGFNSRYFQLALNYNALTKNGIDDSHVALSAIFKIK